MHDEPRPASSTVSAYHKYTIGLSIGPIAAGFGDLTTVYLYANWTRTPYRTRPFTGKMRRVFFSTVNREDSKDS